MPGAILARLCLVEARRGGLPWLALASLLAAVSLAAFLSAGRDHREPLAAALGPRRRAARERRLPRGRAGGREHAARAERQGPGARCCRCPSRARRTTSGAWPGFSASAVLLAAAVFARRCCPGPRPAPSALWGVSLALRDRAGRRRRAFLRHDARAAGAGDRRDGRPVPARALDRGDPGDRRRAARRRLAHRPDRRALAVDAVALLLPRLDVVTRTEWLLYEAPSASAYAARPGRPRALWRAARGGRPVRLPSPELLMRDERLSR